MQLSKSNAIPSNIIKEAATWLSRLKEKPLTDDEQTALEIWRNQSQQHQQAWQRAEQFTQTLNHIPHGLGLAVLDRPTSMSKRAFLKPFALLLVAVPTGIITYRTAPWQMFTADFQTAMGEQKAIQLADGSQLTINTNSAIDVDFDDNQRLITVHAGEIYIETAHDAKNRPLFVQTSHGRLHALGTKFVVRKQDDDSYLGVLESAVDILPKENSTQHTIIRAGQETTFTATQIQPYQILNSNASAWLDGIIYADNMPLSEFVATLSRYRKGVLRCDESIKNVRISGAFQLNKPDEILETLQKTRPIRIQWHTRYWGTIYPS